MLPALPSTILKVKAEAVGEKRNDYCTANDIQKNKIWFFAIKVLKLLEIICKLLVVVIFIILWLNEDNKLWK